MARVLDKQVRVPVYQQWTRVRVRTRVLQVCYSEYIMHWRIMRLKPWFYVKTKLF